MQLLNCAGDLLQHPQKSGQAKREAEDYTAEGVKQGLKDAHAPVTTPPACTDLAIRLPRRANLSDTLDRDTRTSHKHPTGAGDGDGRGVNSPEKTVPVSPVELPPRATDGGGRAPAADLFISDE